MSRAGSIEFHNISKTFSRHTGQMLLRKHVQSWFGWRQKEPFYALRDVSCRIEPGEGVALVGTNGAGKSTLLAVVAGLAEPDGGELSVHGRVGALLQLGAGFHPDLTGRENLLLNASMLGMSRRETNERFDSIVEFSGVGEFIEEPLRTYSSGMNMRLAFAVAVHMDPDILIIDEVLAVGDHAFQAKCRERVRELKRSGKTMLCVSHAAAGIQDLCERAIWLDHGKVVLDGPLADVVAAYEGRVPSPTGMTPSHA
jgi:ABC-type polysaccharide/polyol phosphate transport system ATPase subunit